MFFWRSGLKRRLAVLAVCAAMTSLFGVCPAWAARGHWSVGDTVTREIHGESYRFRCIDDNYSDEMEHHRPGALFLCDVVIPANTGSRYEFRTSGNGAHDYEFCPGPIVNFGGGSDYKMSSVRAWLHEAEAGFSDAEPVNVGVMYAYEGSTARGSYEKFGHSTLRGSFIGSQKLADRLFILSVDEACKYREYLWKFEGAAQNNPQSQYGAFSKGYWLRNPAVDRENSETGLVYAVDLVLGNIRPVRSAPENIADDAELTVTGTIGVRPAFVLPQD